MKLTQEQLELRALAREFAEGELRPGSAAWDEARAIPEEVFASLAETGFLGMLVPEEQGGLDFDLSTYLLVLEELSWGDAAVGLSVAIHNATGAGLIARHGSEAQKSRWLPAMAAGEAIAAFALTEPEAGSDAGAVTATAVRDGDVWRLTGTKRWVTNGARAGVVVVFARTGETVSAFLVEPGSEGYEVTGRETTMGLRASETVTVELSATPGELLGEEGRGLAYALAALDLGRAGIAANAVGVGRAAMEHAARYALEREQFNRPIAKFGAIQVKLAEMARRLSGARLLAHDAAQALQAAANGEGHPRGGADGVTARAAIAKLAASEAATWSADEAVQIFGGYGYMKHYPVEKLLRDAKGAEIYEGSNEIMRAVIAREVLRDAAGE